MDCPVSQNQGKLFKCATHEQDISAHEEHTLLCLQFTLLIHCDEDFFFPSSEKHFLCVKYLYMSHAGNSAEVQLTQDMSLNARSAHKWIKTSTCQYADLWWLYRASCAMCNLSCFHTLTLENVGRINTGVKSDVFLSKMQHAIRDSSWQSSLLEILWFKWACNLHRECCWQIYNDQ